MIWSKRAMLQHLRTSQMRLILNHQQLDTVHSCVQQKRGRDVDIAYNTTCIVIVVMEKRARFMGRGTRIDRKRKKIQREEIRVSLHMKVRSPPSPTILSIARRPGRVRILVAATASLRWTREGRYQHQTRL